VLLTCFLESFPFGIKEFSHRINEVLMLTIVLKPVLDQGWREHVDGIVVQIVTVVRVNVMTIIITLTNGVNTNNREAALSFLRPGIERFFRIIRLSNGNTKIKI
jgi:hypothetical protein